MHLLLRHALTQNLRPWHCQRELQAVKHVVQLQDRPSHSTGTAGQQGQ
jgi:hypothetical protein